MLDCMNCYEIVVREFVLKEQQFNLVLTPLGLAFNLSACSQINCVVL